MRYAAYDGSSKNLGLEEEAEKPLLFECQVETSSTESCWWRRTRTRYRSLSGLGPGGAGPHSGRGKAAFERARVAVSSINY